ncbi:MAG TPA: excinuclease ABC subunit UvrC, partial [Gammaproteobacteria bacterium]|nr:excinuclease ABC subunit UvrC [Gammaproteobacteria bacterium]
MSAFDPDPLLRDLTQRPGVYCMLDEKEAVIYVGKARNLRRRVSSYFRGRAHDAKTIAMLRSVADVQVTVTRTETDALMLEYNLIKQHQPRFNVMLRDDKSYPFIRVHDEHKFPRISFYRGSRKVSGRVFGPYPSAGAVRGAINQLQKLFRLRGCTESYFANRTRPCLQYQIRRCTAPCVGLISEADYARDVADAMLFLEGRSDAVSAALGRRMEEAAEQLQYERAAQYRDQLAELKRIQTQQIVSRTGGDFDVAAVVHQGSVYCVSVMFFRAGRSLGNRNFFPQHVRDATPEEVLRAFILQYYAHRPAPREILTNQSIDEAQVLAQWLSERAGKGVDIRWRVRGDRARLIEMTTTNAEHGAQLRSRSAQTVTEQLDGLAEVLGLDEAPGRIECFDISHTRGSETVASCVVFGADGAQRGEYRRFNIDGVTPGDDYAAMEQVLRRRLKRVARGEAPRPDVLIVDGGPGQLSRASAVMQELACDDICLVGVAKGAGRRPGRETLYVAGMPLRLPG